MHPNAYLKTFWRGDFLPQVFVAMSFDNRYQSRFDDVIVRAVQSVEVDGVPLTAYRVDLSRTGDSILTDIVDGIAHSQLVLADVSTIGKDSVTGLPFRNANVMYEVGIALACRQSAEVLLIREDHDKFLFDVSTIPHMTVDFTDTTNAVGAIRDALKGRLAERQLVDDARIQTMISTLTYEELHYLRHYSNWAEKEGSTPGDSLFGSRVLNSTNHLVFSRLADKQLLKSVAAIRDGGLAYQWTSLGLAMIDGVKRMPQLLQSKQSPSASDEAVLFVPPSTEGTKRGQNDLRLMP